MRTQRIRIHGREITYRAAGSGPVVVLIHGMASSSVTWDGVTSRLAETLSIVALDLPGHGGSTNPGGDHSLGALSSSVRDLMLALGIERATIVGHSLGGGVAMQTAYQFPERCERLVLVDSGGLGREVALYLRALALPGAELLLSAGCSPRLINAGRAMVRALHRAGLRPIASTQEIGRCYASLADPQARVALLHTLRSVIDVGGQRVSAADRLPLASSFPTLIIWGERDSIIPVAHARAAHEAIAGSRLEILPAAGHFPQIEEPGTFVRLIVDFVGSTEPASLPEERLRTIMLEQAPHPRLAAAREADPRQGC